MQSFPTKIDFTSVEPAAEYNNLTSELKTLLTSLSIPFNAGSTTQLAQAIATYVAIGSFYTDSGTINNYILSVSPLTRQCPDQYYPGFRVYFFPSNSNNDISTINVNGLGLKNILSREGLALLPNDIIINQLCSLVYDGTNFRIDSSFTKSYNFDPISFNTLGLDISLKPGVMNVAYNSDWFAVINNQEYIKNTGLNRVPHGIILLGKKSLTDQWTTNIAIDYSSTLSSNDAGSVLGINESLQTLKLKTGSVSIFNSHFIDSTTGNFSSGNVTSGFYKIILL